MTLTDEQINFFHRSRNLLTASVATAFSVTCFSFSLSFVFTFISNAPISSIILSLLNVNVINLPFLFSFT